MLFRDRMSRYKKSLLRLTKRQQLPKTLALESRKQDFRKILDSTGGTSKRGDLLGLTSDRKSLLDFVLKMIQYNRDDIETRAEMFGEKEEQLQKDKELRRIPCEYV